MSPKDWDTNKKLLPFPESAMHTKFGKADFEKKMIKDDAPGTTNDDGGQPIALVT